MGNRFVTPSPRAIAAAAFWTAAAFGEPQSAPADRSTPLDLAAAARPNVIVLLADDLGVADLSVAGATEWKTPNLDALAQSGTRCTAAYVTAPVCAPSRAALLTGRYQQRFGFEFNQGPPPAAAQNFGLPAEETTLAERMRAAGYATGMVGKWHLGELPGQRPTERGFDEFFGFLDNANQYDPTRRRDATSPIFRGTAHVSEKDWLTRAFTRESMAFVDRHAHHPFFLYMAYSAAHAPLQSDPAIAPRVAGIDDVKRRDYANLVLGLDDAVGALMAKLVEKGLDGNTLVVFLSDNGAIQRRSNGALSGGKTSLWEGGIRVPMVVRFKGHVPEGQVYDAPVRIEAAALDVLDPRPEVADRDVVLRLARDRAGVAADAAPVVDEEAVLHRGIVAAELPGPPIGARVRSRPRSSRPARRGPSGRGSRRSRRPKGPSA